jgi:hypothetical protein
LGWRRRRRWWRPRDGLHHPASPYTNIYSDIDAADDFRDIDIDGGRTSSIDRPVRLVNLTVVSGVLWR